MEKALKNETTENVKNVETTEIENKTRKTFNEIVKDLIAKGARKYSAIKVKNVVITEQDNYDRITFVLRKDIPAYVSEDNGNTYVEGTNNLVYSSAFAIGGLLKESDELAWLADYVVKAPEIATNLFCGATITILQERVDGDKPYVRPFSADATPSDPFGHDTYVNHIIGVEFGPSGESFMQLLAEMKAKAALKGKGLSF